MTLLHQLLAYVTLVCAGLVLVAAGLGLAAPRRLRVWLDRAILLALLALGVALLSGLPLIVLASGPADPLHFVYALIGPAMLIGARYWGHDVGLRRRALYMAVAAVALLAVVYRLFTTG
jgi:hypothetical protein